MAGQRWLIELQAVDSHTLLSLVSLIYSGHFNGNQEQVFSAAQSLGIEFPQQHQKERQAGNKGQRQYREDAEYTKVDVREGDEGMAKRMQTGSVKEMRESGTQTEDGTQTNERETPTEMECVDTQNFQTIPVYLIDQSTHFVNQEPFIYTNAQDATLEIQTITGHPEKIPATYDILAMAPETRVCHTVSESAFQINMYSSDYQACTPVPSNPPPTCSTSVDLLEIGGLPASAIMEFEQIEGNTTGVNNNFLHSSHRGKKEQGCLSRGAKEFKKSRARSRGGGRVTEVGGRGCKRQNHMERWGWVAGLAWMGQGGGRVGRKMDTRTTVKQRMKVFQRRRGRGALVKGGETRGWTGIHASNEGKDDPSRPRRPRGRPRLRPLPSASRSLYDQNLVQSPDLTLLHTVPFLPASQVEPTPHIDSFLDDIMAGLHSLPLVPAENQHGFMSSTNSNVQSVSNIAYSVQSHSNSAEPSEVRPPEGELGDILDHFLRTFEQHVGGCSLDMGTETSQEQSEDLSLIKKVNGIQLDKESEDSHPSTIPCNNSFKTCTQLEPPQSSSNHQQILHADISQTSITLTPSNQMQYGSSSVNPTVPEQTQSSGLEQQVSSCPSQGLELEKPSEDQNIKKEHQFRMMTRSQSLKRKLDTDLNISKVLNEKECSNNTSDLTEKKSPRMVCLCCKAKPCKSKERVSDPSMDKNKERQREMHSTRNSLRKRSHREVRSEPKPDKRTKSLGSGRDGVNGDGNKRIIEDRRHGFNSRIFEEKYKGKSCNESLKEIGFKSLNCGKRTGRLEDDVQVGCITAVPQTGQLPIKNTIEKTYGELATSALKKMEILLQIQNENETKQKRDKKQIKKHVKKMANRPILELGPEKRNIPFQLDQPLNSAREEVDINGRSSLCTSESSQNTIDSCLSELVSPQNALSPCSELLASSSKNLTLKMTDLTLLPGATPQPTPAAQVSDSLPDLLTSRTEEMLQASESSDGDELDVLAVSSPMSELASRSAVIWEAGLSTEEEEDVEIDIVGVEFN
ncbi:uncharacterized protein LOC134318713 [Trichomycterus rosablanca]|uniref:uncharacterized protein LOC134318713 n=1 Tax=Trichomycterus rosablanca TaxID=2290929 RepID=UPI002F34F1BB